MGAYTPLPFVTDEDEAFARQYVLEAVAKGMCQEGLPLTGVLYGGLMKTAQGVKVIEFNARFGDPETEAVLPRIEGDFSKALFNAATGNLSDDDIKVSSSAAATVVLSSAGYPGDYAKDKLVSGLENVDEKSVVFHCGTRFGEDGEVLTSGGRVFSVTGVGEDIRKAVDNAYNAVGNVTFEGMYFRKDIAHRAFNRGK
jgi:phosphoribosylamine--glycine ligase